jgi:acetyl-CoA carboxylase biotin carboxylase subunit
MSLRRVLIANRGEIAVRIARACREAGIESVAVHTDADADALHVSAADRAVDIGAANAYLSVDALIAAARSSGADALHPGYGFLSERATLPRACAAAGIVFVGPPADAIEKMGSKIGARALMSRAGVPVVPGQTPANQAASTDDGIAAAASALGFPVLLKASAGGGGKGMRVARRADEVAELAASARREAEAAFGDGTLYVERLIERPRHVEIQVMADTHGNVVHLFERECSIQRRHQKIVEESPSPALTPEVRAQMGEAAVAAARAVGYVNAGTVEFLLEGEGRDARFYFLEMNTRLQVEHPITEAVTGVDLVRAQLAVAGGETLPWTQASLSQRGHAIECRVYAEDPAAGFLPQAGPLLLYREPSGPGIRVDAGVRQGDRVGVAYDPLLAKLIAYGETRAAATARALHALRAYPVLGIRTNIPFLIQLLEHPRFVEGRLHTGVVEELLPDLVAAAGRATLPAEALAAAAVAGGATGLAAGERGGGARSESGARDPWDTLARWGRGE